MKKIMLESSALTHIMHEIEQCCFMLGYVNDGDDLDDVDYYRTRIHRAVDDLRELITKAETAKNEQGANNG